MHTNTQHNNARQAHTAVIVCGFLTKSNTSINSGNDED